MKKAKVQVHASDLIRRKKLLFYPPFQLYFLFKNYRKNYIIFSYSTLLLITAFMGSCTLDKWVFCFCQTALNRGGFVEHLGWTHRYRKSKIDCLRFLMCPLLALVFQGFFFVVSTNSTNEANKACSTRL